MSSRYCGESIKSRRLELGLSQAELAADICSQGMISQIESDNIYPRGDVAVKICKRLNLELTELVENDSYGKTVFSCIAKHLQKHCYQKANDTYDKVNAKLLENPTYKGIHHCFKGFSKLFVEDDVTEALVEFTECLSQYNKYVGDLYIAWCCLGMGLVYKQMGLKEHSLNNVKRAANKLITLKNNQDATIESVTDIYMDVLAVCLELEEFQLVNEFAEAIIDFQKQVEQSSGASRPIVVYRLAEIYEFKSKALFAMGKHFDGTISQIMAYALPIMMAMRRLLIKSKVAIRNYWK
ncbi:helix-turn-helix domain-containing protein [Lentilactobacillus kosonis]|uniref:Transcriptional regulator, Cro/CI family n=1 Tax=Lentilactobacillus kosonis TaxID=2810561 RepID=A0A401FN26_9LACO|nr:helix-turn-helix transcriptional regulator [Lentilactobacillus kosonis]GAY73789.1 transcriptional regulator, Cro/CI family [Lentilactobacillus kosonis]